MYGIIIYELCVEFASVRFCVQSLFICSTCFYIFLVLVWLACLYLFQALRALVQFSVISRRCKLSPFSCIVMSVSPFLLLLLLLLSLLFYFHSFICCYAFSACHFSSCFLS
jgi:hypothetical protein